MDESFKCFALGLALMTTTAIVSASASADSITGTASAIAIVVAPVNVGDTILTYSTSALVSDAPGLIIRLPGTGPYGADSGNSNPASVTPSAVVSNDCLQNVRNLASCIKRLDEDGILKGDPVSNVMLNTADKAWSAESAIGITVTYN